MSAQILLNLLNKLRNRNNMWGLTSILSLFCKAFNKCNNTGVWILDSIYHSTLKWHKNHIFGVKMSLSSFTQCISWKSLMVTSQISLSAVQKKSVPRDHGKPRDAKLWSSRRIFLSHSRYTLLSFDFGSVSEMTPCIKTDKPLVVYRFW